MNLAKLTREFMKEHELPDIEEDYGAIRQQLDRILKAMPEAKNWYKKPGRKGTWNIPDEAVHDTVWSVPFITYAKKRLTKDAKAYREIIAAEEEAEKVTQAEQDWMEERAAKTADDVAREWDEWNKRSSSTPARVVAFDEETAEEITLLLRGVVGLIAAQSGHTFDFQAFHEARRELARIRESNDINLRSDGELSTGNVRRQQKQEELVSDLRNFFA